MAFSFANVASEADAIGGSSNQGAQVHDGEELREIQTSKLGFKTINAEVKVKLLPTPWPAEAPPVPTAQLLSVASSQAILAAAGPDCLVIASTNQVRETLNAKDGDNVRSTNHILTIPHDRLTHVAFSSDESVLVVSGPSTAGLVAYQVEQLKAGNAEVALRIHMNSTLRALSPNPSLQSAPLFAVVNSNGELLVADLSTGQFAEGSNGAALSQGVACIAWSNRGKQLVAGLASGAAVQMKPNGQVVTHIPKSTSIPADSHMSAMTWLEDDTFFAIYTPNSTSAEDGIPPSDYYVIERSNKTNFTWHKLPEILPPFGVERLPTHHFITRLRNFQPHITDLLLLAATTATDIGIVAKSDQPLSTDDNPEDQVANAFTLTSLEDDTRRAALPLSSESLDTSPIGMAIDLSSQEPVINPLPSDPEIQETVGSVPNLLVLNNEGLLCSWWVMYDDSIKEKITFSGFDGLKAKEDMRSAISPPAQAETSPPSSAAPSTFGQATASTASPFSQPTTASSSTTFGTTSSLSSFSAPKLQASSQSGFGSGSGSGFGTSSKIGENRSSWASSGFGTTTAAASGASSGFGQPGFGQPAFGSTSAIGSDKTPAFGTPSAFGSRPAGFAQSSSPAFGKTGFGSSTTSSPFATAGSTKGNSGFASFASAGGFGSPSTKQDDDKSSAFAKPGASAGFSSFAGSGAFGSSFANKGENKESPFAKPASGAREAFPSLASSESPFAKLPGSAGSGQGAVNGAFSGAGFGGFANNEKPTQSAFGASTPFKLESSFKGDGTAKDDLPLPKSGGGFGFGSGLGSLLGETKKDVSPTQSPEADMDDDNDEESHDDDGDDEKEKSSSRMSLQQQRPNDGASNTLTTPPSTIAQSKTTPAAPVSSLFGSSSQQTTTPQQPLPGFAFNSTTPQETPAASRTLFGTKPVTSTTPAVVQNSEPVKSFGALDGVQKPTSAEPHPSNKLNVDSTRGSTTANIKSGPDAPLPPDPVSKPGYTTGDTSASSANSKESKEPEDAPLPPDFLPANKSATKAAEEVNFPEEDDDADNDEFSSDFEDSGEEVTQEMSPVEEGADQEEDTTIENIQTSPESSFKGNDSTSPTGGLFTKVTANDSKSARPLFGEVSRPAPVFPPPKTQQSPRSPSPVRPFTTHDTLRPDSRSVSAPIRPRSAIDQRKADYSQSAIAAQAIRAREEEAARERAKQDAIRAASEQAKADELQKLEDDEDERVQRELAAPLEPSQDLDEFITYQASPHMENSKADIPAQIERLYQDINSMVYTLGINARSLSSFLLYQKDRGQDQRWPGVLRSDTPMDALDEEWSLDDIRRLHEGSASLADDLANTQVHAVPQKLESCQSLLTKDIAELRTKITAIRKSIHARSSGSAATAPLSAEQASIQHDLRKASAAAQTKLVQIEDGLVLMRARLAEAAPLLETKASNMVPSQSVQKKPTVEAVTNTVLKMTLMAERKSADIDVLEAQLKKLDSILTTSTNGGTNATEFSTPRRSKPSRAAGTPGSTVSSVFYTPDSKAAVSPSLLRSGSGGANLSLAMVSAEDRERWRGKAKRKKDVAATLKAVLEEKRKKGLVTG